jgi:hypothetical protein
VGVRVVSGGVVSIKSLGTTRQSTIFYRLLLN